MVSDGTLPGEKRFIPEVFDYKAVNTVAHEYLNFASDVS